MIVDRDEIPSEHGALCSGKKNGRAAVREKWRTAGIKSEGKPPSTLEAGETGVCLERDAPRKNSLAAAVEEMVRKASEKKTAVAER